MRVKKKYAFVFMFLAAFSLATIGVFVKKIGVEVHFMTLNFLRVFVAFLFLLPILPVIDKTTLKPQKADIKQYAMIGFLMACSTALYNTAFQFAPVQNVVLINYVYPFFVMIFARFLLKETINKTKIISALIAIIGLIIINPLQVDAGMTGNLLALSSAFIFALVVVKMRQIDRTHTIGSVLRYFFFASLFLARTPFVWGFGNIAAVWPFVLGVGVIGTGVAYLFFNFGLEELEAEIGAIISMTTAPLIAIILAVIFLGETVNLHTAIGGVILILGGVYLELKQKKKKKFSRKKHKGEGHKLFSFWH